VEHPGLTVAWGVWAIVKNAEDGFGGLGSIDSGAGFDPAPDLDHKNERVRESIKDWLRYLSKEIGYSGWRLDYVKVSWIPQTSPYSSARLPRWKVAQELEYERSGSGSCRTWPGVRMCRSNGAPCMRSDASRECYFSIPVQGYAPKFVKEYIYETVGPLAPNVGEYWTDMNWEGSTLGHHQDGARQALCDVLDATEGALNMFDFPTKGILQEAVRNCEYWRLADQQNKPPGLLGWWPEKAVTFLDNHDTGVHACSLAAVAAAAALSRPGTSPCTHPRPTPLSRAKWKTAKWKTGLQAALSSTGRSRRTA
jgi:glycosidase